MGAPLFAVDVHDSKPYMVVVIDYQETNQMPAGKKSDQIVVIVDEKVGKALRELASSNRRSLSNQAAFILESYLNREGLLK